MRAALTPKSLRPKREDERRSMRLPDCAGAIRMAMSSVKPIQRLLWLASNPACRLVRYDDRPTQLLSRIERSRECHIGLQSDGQRLDVRISSPLLIGYLDGL